MASSSSATHLSPTSLSKRDRLLMDWPFNLESHSPAVTFGSDVAFKLAEFEKSQLSRETAVNCVRYTRDHSVLKVTLSEEFSKGTIINNADHLHELLFINRFIIKSDAQNLPKDIKRLRISKLAFRNLVSHLEVSPMSISSIASGNLASLPVQHRHLGVKARKIFDTFYLLPVRLGIPCSEDARSHALSPAGSNQMNPSQYLHLHDFKQDIRPSRIAVFSQHDKVSHQTRVICLDFQDGRWAKFAEEPLFRTNEVLARASGLKRTEGPFFFHLLVLTSVSEWWRCALNLFNMQLIAFEKKLQQQSHDPQPLADEFVNETNKSLHNMVAHLHRYKTETDLLQEIALNLSIHCHCSCISTTNKQGEEEGTISIPKSENGHHDTTPSNTEKFPSTDSCLKSIALEFRTLSTFVSELVSKTQTILDLLFNNMRVSNDKLLVANGDSMRQILIATSAETRLSRKMAKQSQLMAAGMRKDSTSMKTVAVMTMFFLPATSFAAILSMPVFAQTKWMASAERGWLWVVLSVPSTLVAFTVFYVFTRRGDKEIGEVSEFDLSSIDETI